MRGLFLLVLAVSCCQVSTGMAQNYRGSQYYPQRGNTVSNPHWSQSLATERKHDFGTVAKASFQQHIFRFANTLDSDLHLVSVRASCGCIKPKILTSVVKPGETAEVLVDFDTRNFDGQRAATATVGIQRRSPHTEYSEIQFSITGMIRRDVVIDPLTVDFGTVLFGTEQKRAVTVKYAGNPNWKINSVNSSNPNIHIALEETKRDASIGRVEYLMTLTVAPDQEIGPINDHLTVTTSDYANQNISVPLQGYVKTAIQAPSIQLGMVRKGESLQKGIVLKGDRAFEILQIKHSTNKIHFEQPTGQKTLHVLHYKLDTSEEGVVEDSIVVVTNDPSQPEIRIEFGAQVVQGTIVKDK